MQMDSVLMELLTTRLCHDLTGPIGAMGNGVEFLAESDEGMREQALDLLSSSAKEAVARLQFYRQCYGRVVPGGASLSEKKQLVEGFLAAGKLTLDWPESMTDSLAVHVSHAFARILINMVLLASTTAIRQGTLEVRIYQESATLHIHATARCSHVKWEEKQAKAARLALPPEEWDPKLAQIIWLAKQVQDTGGQWEVNLLEGAVDIVAHLPL